MFVCPECGAPNPNPGQCPADGAAVLPIGDDVLLGSTIGAYRIARLLGIGGMGRVYKGVHPTIGSRVAIKVLSRECTDRRELVDRFFAEARAVNLIRHESIVNVLDLEKLPDGRPYIIMEYLDGAPLAAIIEHAVATRTPLPLGGLARLAVEVLDALGAAHAKGIVHRDLKPDNIFVTPSGRPKVLDFGIAKLNDMATGSATRTGSLLGTPHYMSPEQAGGKPVEHRADIYAMGVILFECVTGQKPFVAESLFELLRLHIEVPPPAPRALRPEMSAELENVILTALSKSPDQRFGSAQAMSVALQHATSRLAPEQWTPITGSGTHRAVSSGVWQPTPPQSWGNTGMPRAPRESVQPPHLGQQSTVSASAGQLQKAPTAVKKPTSKKGLWIAVGAVLLVGAGVTTAVVAGGGDKEQIAAKPVADEPSAPPVVADKEDDEKPEPTEKAADAIDKLEPKMNEVKQKTAELEKKLDQLEKKTKMPVEEAKAEAKPEPKVADAKPGGTPPPKAGANSIWDGSFSLGTFKTQPNAVDFSAFVKWAVAEAKRADPDAVLIRVDANHVNANGIADLTLPNGPFDASIDLRFVSMERGKPDPNLPVGVTPRDKTHCEFRIELGPSGVPEIRTISPGGTAASSCIKQAPIPAPRCTAAALWKKAIAKGAPATGAVASLGYRSNIVSKKIQWFFDIGQPGDKIFSDVFADDC